MDKKDDVDPAVALERLEKLNYDDIQKLELNKGFKNI